MTTKKTNILNSEENTDDTFVVSKNSSILSQFEDVLGKTPTQILDSLEESIRSKATKPNGNHDTLNILLLILDEVSKTKLEIDEMRLEAKKDGKFFDSTKVMNRWIKSVELLYKHLKIQDEISFDIDGIRKIAAYIMKTMTDVMVEDMRLEEYYVEKFKEHVELRKPALNQFVKNVAHETQAKNS